MDTLADILSGADDESAASETASTAAAAATTTDVKTATTAAADKPAKEAAAATSAAKTPEQTAAAAKDEPADKTGESETEAQAAERTRNEKGQFAKPSDEVAALRKAATEERRKRQEAERERDEARKAKEGEAPKKDFLEDPEGAFQERLTPIQQKYESELFELREELVRAKHDDYDDVVNELMEEAKADPALAVQLNAQFNAAGRKPQFLYTFATNRREMKAVGGDLGKYKETIKTEFKTKISTLEAKVSTMEAENKALKTQLENVGKVPDSLNSASSAARAAVQAEALDDEPLGDILKSRKRRSA